MALQLGGSNSLRGGKKKFGPKTKCGNWVELDKEPGQSLPSGFPHAMYRTDAQQQMLEGVLQRPKRFGAGLPPTEDPAIDYNRVINYDKRQGDSQWAGITSTEFVAPGSTKGKELSSSFKMAGGIVDPAELNKYRNTWTMEADSARLVRFKTDAVTSANMGVPARFRLGETRKLPGKPKAVEHLRAKALESGNMGVVKLRKALQHRSSRFGACPLEQRDLVEGLKSVGVALCEADTTKVIEFFAQGGDRVARIADIFRGLSGPLNERRRQAVSDAFLAIDETGNGIVGAESLRKRFGAARADSCIGISSEEQEVREALLDNWVLYQDGEEDGLTRAGLEAFLVDASCGVENDDGFEAMVASLLRK